MKKKGFTLIELLAVIVILAIIALIATPLVLKYIEKSRKESKVDSAYSFVRNLETEIANYAINNNGKKYNKAPIGGDYYEFKDFDTDKDIDTTVKGDKPNTIKVCLSSLGQVEKAMFKYDKYYVSYDGKKGSISDKDTYDNFSCSGDNKLDILYEINGVFEEGQMLSLEIDKTIFDKFDKPGYEYDVIIDDKYLFTTFAVEKEDLGLFQMVSDDFFVEGLKGVNVFMTEQGFNIYINFPIENPSEPHNIKIYYPKETENDGYFTINKFGEIAIIDYDFIEGAASVLIEGEDGTSYINEEVELIDKGGIFGTDNNILESTELYSAIQQGKKVIITVNQKVGNDSVVTTFNTENVKEANSSDETYYVGHLLLRIFDSE